jgi:hypothetical protein
MSPVIRKRIAGIMAITATIAWPVTQMTVARDEPPFTLGLSWFAIVLTALDIWLTTDVRVEEDDANE